MKIYTKNDFYIFVPIHLEIRPFDLKFAPLITVDLHNVSTELEVSRLFYFEKIGDTGRRSRQTECGLLGRVA